MIHQTPINSRVSNETSETKTSSLNSWQKALAQGFRDTTSLFQYLKIPLDLIPNLSAQASIFPMRIPIGFADRMKTRDPNDPLLLQVLPTVNELQIHPNYTSNPVGDIEAMIVPGLLHKYFGRVLITVTGNCAVHCRYCFRQHFPYSDTKLNTLDWTNITNYIQNDPSINEVILSGGDPLTLSDRRLANIVTDIESIKHVKYLRLHSRLPIVLPERINSELLTLLRQTRLKVVLVIHCNHPNEIDESVKLALKQCYNANLQLLNQSVLLKNVNDNANTLANLSKKLFDNNVLPYYLHLLDKVSGAQHFDLPRASALTLYQQLQEKLPGYLVPKLVQEIAGQASKTSCTR